MQRIFSKARDILSTLPSKASESWGKLGAKNLAKTAGLLAATVLLLSLSGAAAASGTVFGAAPFLLVGAAMSYSYFLDSGVKLWRSRKDLVWWNDAGQKIKSTRGQKADLDAAQARIYRVLDLGASASAPGQNIGIWTAQKLAARFERAASRVTVVEDITPPAGKFTFAARGPAVPLAGKAACT